MPVIPFVQHQSGAPAAAYRPGSREDFDRLYQTAYPRVYRTLAAILADPAEAEDCAQDSFVQAFQAWARWQPTAPAEAWIHRIAVGLVALTAFVATGSPNPVVWSERIVTVIEPASAPQATPPSVASQTPSPREAVAPPPPTHHETPQAEPSEKPEASPTPEAHESPEPSGDGGGGSDDHGGASPSPSSGSGDH